MYSLQRRAARPRGSGRGTPRPAPAPGPSATPNRTSTSSPSRRLGLDRPDRQARAQNASNPGICVEDLSQPLDRPQVTAAGAGLGQAQHLGDLGGAELLEVLQGQHLAVDRVHAVERLLHQQAGLGLDGGLRRRGQRAQQLGRQRDRVGHRQAAAVQRDLAVGVAELGAEVAAVDLGQLQRRSGAAARGRTAASAPGRTRRAGGRPRRTPPGARPSHRPGPPAGGSAAGGPSA